MAAAEALLLAAGLVFVAELGDKSQLLVLAASLRGRAVPVLLGAVAAFLVLTAAAATVGALLGDALPTAAVLVGGGVLFVGLGIKGWLDARRAGAGAAGSGPKEGLADGSPASQAGTAAGAPGAARHFGATFLVVLVGELGDKTQLATVGLAARGHPVATALGAMVGLTASAVLAVAAGHWLQSRLRPRLVARAGAVLFVVLGLASIAVGVARL